jgi:hypothetical protein
MIADISERCDTIEECYEFMLAYAAQGLPSDEGSQSCGEIRGYLSRAVRAMSDLAESCAIAVERERLEPAQPYHTFLAVLDRDAHDSLAAIELVLAQRAISSQLIDNLNASIHLRALLTDLFLLSEIVDTQRRAAKAMVSGG